MHSVMMMTMMETNSNQESDDREATDKKPIASSLHENAVIDEGKAVSSTAIGQNLPHPSRHCVMPLNELLLSSPSETYDDFASWEGQHVPFRNSSRVSSETRWKDVVGGVVLVDDGQRRESRPADGNNNNINVVDVVDPSEKSWKGVAEFPAVGVHGQQRRASFAGSCTSRHSSTATPDSTSSSHKRHRRRRRRQCDSLTAHGNKRQFVEHNYHDYANEDIGSSVAQASSALTMMRCKNKGRFPLLLHQMLETAEKENLTNIISWQSHGRSFMIKDRERFAQEFLPRFCCHNKFKSFQRQLNLYGFKRLTRDGPDQGSHYHELFLRDKAMLSLSMERLHINGKGIRTSSSPETEPNFYTMPSVSAESTTAFVEYLCGVELYSSSSSSSSSSSGDEKEFLHDVL